MGRTERICQRAIAHYGERAQKEMAIEEMSELIKEICKDFRGKPDLNHIAEEIADVEIMLEQLKQMYSATSSEECSKGFRTTVWITINQKIDRLEERMDNEDRQ